MKGILIGIILIIAVPVLKLCSMIFPALKDGMFILTQLCIGWFALIGDLLSRIFS